MELMVLEIYILYRYSLLCNINATNPGEEGGDYEKLKCSFTYFLSNIISSVKSKPSCRTKIKCEM